MSNLTTIVSVAGAAFAASFVEAVEALTIVLAVGLARGWRPALTGAAAALAALTLIVAALGPLMGPFRSARCRASSACCLLLFGLRWLRKAILRAIGIVALHDEDAAFARETRELTRGRAAAGAGAGLDRRRHVFQGRAPRGDRGRVHRHRGRRGARPSWARERRRSGGLCGGDGDRRGDPSAAGERAGECAQVRGRRDAFGLRTVLDRREPRRRMAGRRWGDPRLRRDVPWRRLTAWSRFSSRIAPAPA